MTTPHDLAPPPVDGRRPHFALAKVAHGMLYLSGQLPFGPDKQIVGGDVSAQTQTCLNNIDRVLADHGLTLADLTKTTVWLTKVEDFAAFNHAYAEALPGPDLPARSTVRADLMVPGALVEIEAIAAFREPRA